MSRNILRFIFKVGVGLGLAALVFLLASFVMPHLWSKYLGMIVGIAFAVIKAGAIFDRQWPKPNKGWAE
ncbi:hypothetical protein [Sphingopyxis sp. NJF-3]